MDQGSTLRVAATLAFWAAALMLHVLNLGSGSLAAWDEGLSAERALEMALLGDWLTPHLGGSPDFNKPPLYYWLVMAGYRLFGVTELAVRLPSALLGLACLGLTWLFGRRATGSRAGGFVAAGLLLANPHWMETTRHGLLDSGFVAAMLAGAWLLVATPRLRASRALLAGALIGLGALVKNPLAGLAFVVPLSAWCLEKRVVPRRELALALASFAVVGGSWYAAELLVHGRAFSDFYLGHNVWERFTTPIEGQRSSPTLYARKWLHETPVTLLAFVAPLAWLALRDRARLRPAAPLLAFVGVWLLLLHVSASKRPVYLAVVHPFVAAASAPLLCAAGERLGSRRLRRGIGLAGALAAALVLAARYDARLDESPELAALARSVRARAAPHDAVYAHGVPAQLVSFYAQHLARPFEGASLAAPPPAAVWVLGRAESRQEIEATLRRWAPERSRGVAVECPTARYCLAVSSTDLAGAGGESERARPGSP